MNAPTAMISAALVLAVACTAANAEYVCASAPTGVDQRACAAAEQGPAALRRFVQSWVGQMSNLYFPDYVDENTERNWEAKSRIVKQTDTDTSIKVAASERQ
jgi:hypothetical protein